jgi:hypothetical protein
MRRVLKRLTSSVLLTALVGALLVTNTAPAAGTQVDTVASVEMASAGQCQRLTPAQMQGVYGGNLWEDLTLVVDIGCGATSLLGVFGKVHPAAVGFCAGWFIGRLITG